MSISIYIPVISHVTVPKKNFIKKKAVNNKDKMLYPCLSAAFFPSHFDKLF